MKRLTNDFRERIMLKVMRWSVGIKPPLKSMWNTYECERDRANLAILNFSATSDLLEKGRELSSAELLEGDLRARLLSERSNDTEIQITGFVIDHVVLHGRLNTDTCHLKTLTSYCVRAQIVDKFIGAWGSLHESRTEWAPHTNTLFLNLGLGKI